MSSNEKQLTSESIHLSYGCGMEMPGIVVNKKQLDRERLTHVSEIAEAKFSSWRQICEILSQSQKMWEKKLEDGHPIKEVHGVDGKMARGLLRV